MNELEKLKNITDTLRGENGCEWDKKQTHESMIPHLLEETYEVIHAIEKKDYPNLKEELGDLLFLVFFQSRLAEEKNIFNITDVAKDVSEKLIRRHPHIFSSKENLSPEEVLKNWEKIKSKEKENSSSDKLLMDSIPNSFPSLIKAEKIQKQAATVGFDWDEIDDVKDKLNEEVDEFLYEVDQFRSNKNNKIKLENELGDILFSIVNLARFLNLSPEIALNRTCNKFIDRFNFMEEYTKKNGMELKKLNLGELELLWKKAKEKEQE